MASYLPHAIYQRLQLIYSPQDFISVLSEQIRYLCTPFDQSQGVLQ